MLKVILIVIVAFFSAVGVCDLLHSLWEKLLTPKRKPLTLHISFLDGQTDDEFLLWITDHIKWYGKKLAEHYLVVTSKNDKYKLINSVGNLPIKVISTEDFLKIEDFYEQYRIKRNG